MSDEKVLNVYGAINAVMADVPFITKDRENKMQHFKYRGIDDIYCVFHPPMVKRGLCCLPSVLESTSTIRKSNAGGDLFHVVLKVKFTFIALDGTSVESVTMGEAFDSGDKAFSKAMSVAMKYCFFEVFCIPTGEPDADQDTHELAPTDAPRSGPVRSEPGERKTGRATPPRTAPDAPPAGAGNVPVCPDCGSPMRERVSKTDGGKFWGCTTYPACKKTLPHGGTGKAAAKHDPEQDGRGGDIDF